MCLNKNRLIHKKRRYIFTDGKSHNDGIELPRGTYVNETAPSACFLQECEEFVRLRFLLLLFRVSTVPSMRYVLLCSGGERGQPETQGSSLHGTCQQL